MRKLILLPCVIALFVTAMSLGASSASADDYYCWNSQVNNANKCWGPGSSFSSAKGWGNETGVCVGFDASGGTCAPVFTTAHVYGVPGGTHYPWIIGTGGNFTHAFGELNH